MIEDQDSIVEWQDETFGKPLSKLRSAVRLNIEMAELLEAIVTEQDDEKIAMECADVLIVLYGVADLTGFDIHETVNKKMEINRNREWYVDGTGHGQHLD
ncbi:nucleotide pyrophosphohydrolase [bacterium]|nr:nucleotide pyrophosphohydrolase [bacterium]